MAVFSFFERKLSWHYLTDGGADLFGVLAAQLDDAYVATKHAVRQRFLNLCLDEALPYIAQNYNLDYPARFTPARARTYIGDPWEHWSDAGT